jgi:hypothetical protein
MGSTAITEDAGNFTYDPSLKVLKSGAHILSGLGGNGYLTLAEQSAAPSTPSSAAKLYADTNANLGWVLPTAHRYVLDSTLISGNRVLQFPDTTDQFTTNNYPQTLTQKTITASSNVLSGVTMTLGSDATGDTYYRNSATRLARLPIGAQGQAMIVGASGTPTWGSAVSNVKSSTITYDEFLTGTVNLVWSLAASGGSSSIIIPAAANSYRPGICSLNTGAAATNRSAIGGVSTTVLFESGAGITYTYETDIFIPVLSSSTQRFQVVAGFANNFTYSAASATMAVTYTDNVNGGAFVCEVKNPGSTAFNTAVTVAPNTWYRITIVSDNLGNANFYINGVSQTTIAAPQTNASIPMVNIISSVGNTSKSVYIDYLSLAVDMATAR